MGPPLTARRPLLQLPPQLPGVHERPGSAAATLPAQGCPWYVDRTLGSPPWHALRALALLPRPPPPPPPAPQHPSLTSARLAPLPLPPPHCRMYAFDVHCNAYFPMFLLLYVLQLALCPVLLMDGLAARALSCTLYATGMSYYFYLTFLGYSALPFLERAEVGGWVAGCCRPCRQCSRGAAAAFSRVHMPGAPAAAAAGSCGAGCWGRAGLGLVRPAPSVVAPTARSANFGQRRDSGWHADFPVPDWPDHPCGSHRHPHGAQPHQAGAAHLLWAQLG